MLKTHTLKQLVSNRKLWLYRATGVLLIVAFCSVIFSEPAYAQLGDGCANQTPDQCLEGNSLMKWVQIGVNFLAAGVGLVVTIMIILGGIRYITAGENSQAVVAAKEMIRNAFIALFSFALIYSFLQWAIPGGIF